MTSFAKHWEMVDKVLTKDGKQTIIPRDLYSPTITYIPESNLADGNVLKISSIEIEFSMKFNWRLSCDLAYRKKIIPEFIQKYSISDAYWRDHNGCITIKNIAKIAEENKQTIEQIANTIKNNLISNAEAPRAEPSEVMTEIKMLLYILTFGVGIGLVITIASKF